MIEYGKIAEQAHEAIEYIFRFLLPQNGLAVREEQIKLCHQMLESLIQKRIVVCEAGVGIGKTYAYLIACTLLNKYYPQGAGEARTVVISTSSVALQDAVSREYVPYLSRVLMENAVIEKPLRAIIRKGKERFTCDARLNQRLAAVDGKPKNKLQLEALLSLERYYDMDDVPGLSKFDRKLVAVPTICPKRCEFRGICRYHRYLKQTQSPEIFIQICNHNYLLADAGHRQGGLHPLLQDYRALVVDEAHKLPEAAHQVYGGSISAESLGTLCHLLEEEHLTQSAQHLRENFRTLLASLARGELLESSQRTAFVLTPEREAALIETINNLQKTRKRLDDMLPRWVIHRLEGKEQELNLFLANNPQVVLYIQYDLQGNPTLCYASRETPEQLKKALWGARRPAILTSGTLRAGDSFQRAVQLSGLEGDPRLSTFTAASPFDYLNNCLLYIPENEHQVRQGGDVEVNFLCQQIKELICATHGHTLVLFTSYRLMGRVFYRLEQQGGGFPMLEARRHPQDVIRRFKQLPNAVLLATGACWEGVDFPGDMVSSLTITRLPFPVPDPLSEAERERYPSLQDYIRAVVVPDMQRKLRQGFGRAIRTETDTCVVSILDPRAAKGQRYRQVTLSALPECQITDNLEDVHRFVREKKPPTYFD